ncbi:MAG: hypothetical protein WB580_17640, partial [Candidatus Binataceae bacterium]
GASKVISPTGESTGYSLAHQLLCGKRRSEGGRLVIAAFELIARKGLLLVTSMSSVEADIISIWVPEISGRDMNRLPGESNA